MDFTHNQLAGGGSIRVFDVIDGFNREALGTEVDFSLPSGRVIPTLKQIIGRGGKPAVIRCDNGPEYLSAAIVEWVGAWGIELEYIQPGKHNSNAFIERFIRVYCTGRARCAPVRQPAQVQAITDRWLVDYANTAHTSRWVAPCRCTSCFG